MLLTECRKCNDGLPLPRTFCQQGCGMERTSQLYYRCGDNGARQRRCDQAAGSWDSAVEPRCGADHDREGEQRETHLVGVYSAADDQPIRQQHQQSAQRAVQQQRQQGQPDERRDANSVNSVSGIIALSPKRWFWMPPSSRRSPCRDSEQLWSVGPLHESVARSRRWRLHDPARRKQHVSWSFTRPQACIQA